MPPRKILVEENRHVVVQAPPPKGMDDDIYVNLLTGVYLGILELQKITTGKINVIRLSPDYEFEIKR